MKKPFGSDLYIVDGEWVVPYGLLLVLMIFGDIIWVKSIMFVMFVVLSIHIVYEHKKVFGKKDLLMKEFMTFGAFVVCYFINFLMPIYASICYATYASQLKKKKKTRELADKIKTYSRMFVITALAIILHVLFVISYSEEFRASQAPQVVTDAPGTMKMQTNAQ